MSIFVCCILLIFIIPLTFSLSVKKNFQELMLNDTFEDKTLKNSQQRIWKYLIEKAITYTANIINSLNLLLAAKQLKEMTEKFEGENSEILADLNDLIAKYEAQIEQEKENSINVMLSINGIKGKFDILTGLVTDNMGKVVEITEMLNKIDIKIDDIMQLVKRIDNKIVNLSEQVRIDLNSILLLSLHPYPTRV
jgi:hypothetical protein